MNAEKAGGPGPPEEDDERLGRRRRMALQDVETWVDQAIRQAERRGDFDNLPGAGQPLRSLEGAERDPDWWIKGLVEREQLDLSGAMPSGLALRRERERLPQVLVDLDSEVEVRQRLEDFNERVLADRRRPHLGAGSPVVVGRADVEEHVEQWRRARAERDVEAAAQQGSEEPSPEHAAAPERSQRRWFRSRRRGDH